MEPKNMLNTKDVLDPILDVFGGADGGVAFTKLRHSLIPKLCERVADGDASELEEEVMVTIQQFSRLCQLALEGKI